MRKTNIITLISVCIMLVAPSFNLSAKEGFGQFNGIVVEKGSGAPLPFATIALYQPDSTLVTGSSTAEDGSFMIENIQFGSYLIQVTYIGYTTYSADLLVDNEKMDLGTIELAPESTTLSGVVITERRPVIVQKMDKLIVNVADAISTQGSNAVALLKKAPGVMVSRDGNITLNGNSVSIWIDGRPTYLSGKDLETLLKGTDGTTIDKIEIMANPSAKYDAQGAGGIIDIITKKNFLKGFNGGVNGSFGGMNFANKDGFDSHFDYDLNGSLNLGYRADKSNTMLMLSGASGKEFYRLNSVSYLDGVDNYQKSSVLDGGPGSYGNARLAHDWFIDKKNTAGAIITVATNEADGGTKPENSWTETFLEGEKIYTQRSDANRGFNVLSLNTNLNFTHVFDEKTDHEITFNADFARYRHINSEYQDNPYYDNDGNILTWPERYRFETEGSQYISFYSAKADWKKKIFGKGNIEAGVKHVTTISDNKSDRKDLMDGQMVPNPVFSSAFQYRESVSAAYVSFAMMFSDKFSAKAGLRGEYTDVLGEWTSIKKENTNKYLKLFPTLFIGYNSSQNWRLAFSYSYRIGRPDYWKLNPQRRYLSLTTVQEGNPELQPQFTHALNLGIGYGQYIYISAIYNGTTGFFAKTPYVNEETGEQSVKWNNFGRYDLAGINISLAELPIFKWMLFSTNILTCYMGSTDRETKYNQHSWYSGGQGSFTFLLPETWKIECGVWYNTSYTRAYSKSNAQWSTSMGVNKSFLDSRATLSLNIRDLFRSDENIEKMYTPGGQLAYEQYLKYYAQRIQLSFSLRFGQNKATKQRKVGVLEELQRTNKSE